MVIRRKYLLRLKIRVCKNWGQLISHHLERRIFSDLPQLHIDPTVTLILLFNILEIEIKGLSLTHFSGSGEFLREGKEFVVIAAESEVNG